MVKKTIAWAALALLLVVGSGLALLLAASDASGMACPGDRVDHFTLRLDSVTVDGVATGDLSPYYDLDLVIPVIEAERADPDELVDADGVYRPRVHFQFHARVANLRSYDETYELVAGDR